MSKLSRDKGKTFERLLARLFSRVLGVDAKRGIGQAREGGEVSDVDGVPGAWVEAKHRRAVNIREALMQAETARGARNVWPVVVAKYHGDSMPVVAMRLDDFLRLYREWYTGEHGGPDVVLVEDLMEVDDVDGEALGDGEGVVASTPDDG